MPHSSSAGSSAPVLRQSRYDGTKRAIDVLLAALLLVATLPLFVAIAAIVWLSSPGPVFYRGVRVGRRGVPFRQWKFRTMVADAERLGGEKTCAHDERITAVGRKLRATKLDELPQLLNVLRGEMSLVGPRPSLPWEVELYTTEQRRRHGCLPGMTGLWQVSGRKRLPIPEMLALDLVYLRTRSLALDLRILARTPAAILFDRSVR